jgi:hypothetical protein
MRYTFKKKESSMKPTHHLRIPRKLLVAFLVIFMAIAACSGSNSAIPSPSPNDVATVVAATMQALQPPQATPTLVPPPTIAPTATFPLLPPTPVLPAATRINFLTGATAGDVTGTIQPGQSLFYVLNAAQGQPMIANVDSPNQDITMSIMTAGGTSLLYSGPSLKTLLPVTDDYYFTIFGGASSENFTLTVDTPAVINFVTGKNKATVSGTIISGGSIVSYVIYAQQNQHMEVDLNGVGQDAALTVWGFSDGQQYVRSVTGETTFSKKLPMTEDYIIDIVPSGSMVVNYTLIVTVK